MTTIADLVRLTVYWRHMRAWWLMAGNRPPGDRVWPTACPEVLPRAPLLSTNRSTIFGHN